MKNKQVIIGLIICILLLTCPILVTIHHISISKIDESVPKILIDDIPELTYKISKEMCWGYAHQTNEFWIYPVHKNWNYTIEVYYGKPLSISYAWSMKDAKNFTYLTETEDGVKSCKYRKIPMSECNKSKDTEYVKIGDWIFLTWKMPYNDSVSIEIESTNHWIYNIPRCVGDFDVNINGTTVWYNSTPANFSNVTMPYNMNITIRGAPK